MRRGVACQPQARRRLVLDLALSDPLALDATAQPWHDAGYTAAWLESKRRGGQ